MVTGGLLEEARAMQDGAALRVFCRKHHPGDAGHGNGACAHDTRLQRDVQRGPDQPLIAEQSRSSPDHLHLGMSRRVPFFQNPIAVAGKHGSLG